MIIYTDIWGEYVNCENIKDKINELEFLAKLREIKLGYHKDIVTYLDEEMFRIIIYDSEVDINNVLRLLK